MNYTKASTGGGSNLTYPMQQVTINLDSADFTKLNTTPLTLIATDNTNYICVANQFIEYHNNNINIATFALVGFEPILSAFPNSATASLYGAVIQGQSGLLSQSYLNYAGPRNALHNSNLVLWSPADDALCIFAKFTITINYFLIPKFL